MQSAGDLLCNVQDTNDQFFLKKSIQYYVWKELCGIRQYLLNGVEVDATLWSLSRLSEKFGSR